MTGELTPSHDEGEHAKLVADYFGTNHTELFVEEGSAHFIDELSKQFDEPIADTSMIPTMFLTKEVSKYCKVAIGGDGGDELFGGYPQYSRLAWMERYFKYIPGAIGKLIAGLSKNHIPDGVKGKQYLESLEYDLNIDLPLLIKYLDRKTLTALTGCETRISEEVWQAGIHTNGDIVQRATRTDFEHLLPGLILTKVDRTSMLNSLEVRAPFLDHKLVEFVFREIPSHLKANTGQKKILLKMLAKRILPPSFDYRRKQGFVIPLSSWLKGGVYREFFWDTLLSGSNDFDMKTVEKLLKGQDHGLHNESKLFSLVVFVLWQKHYGVSF